MNTPSPSTGKSSYHHGDLKQALLDETARILREEESRAEVLLSKYRSGLELISEALLEHETIDGPTVAKLIQQGLDESGVDEQIDANVLPIPD